MILTNEQVARAARARGGCRRSTASTRSPTRPRIERLVEQLAALGVPTPPLRPRGSSPQQAGAVAAEASRLVGREAARRGHGREAYTSLVLRSLKQAHYSERNSGHAGLGSAAYTPLHLADPPLPRPASSTGRCWRRWGRGRRRRAWPRRARSAADCSARERESAKIERDADDVCAAYLLERELCERGLDAEFEGEVSGVIRAGAFVSFGGELGDVYEGMLPARRAARRALRARRGRDRAGRPRTGRRGAARRPGRRSASTGVDAPRGRVDLEPADG